jgi:hypothetical protein
VIGACLGGAGIARVKAIGVQDFLANGRLVDLLPDWPGQPFSLYALYPAGPHPAPEGPGVHRLHGREDRPETYMIVVPAIGFELADNPTIGDLRVDRPKLSELLGATARNTAIVVSVASSYGKVARGGTCDRTAKRRHWRTMGIF